jgi:biofilm PGA synthesis N-glycosyltransferase PgaC
MNFEDPRAFSENLSSSSPSDAATSASSSVRYCIITPSRDEELYLEGTIESVLRQTILPQQWVIVDDGSTDATSAIIEKYARQYPWIRTFRRHDRGFRSSGGGVEAFLEAYPQLTSLDWEFLVNLDGDVTFAPDYFEKCFAYFRKWPQLGIGGGTIYDKIGDRLFLEKAPAFHVRGATKIYRRACWEKLEGLLPGLGWDTVDEIRANHLGWMTRTFPDLQLIHHRATGDALGTWNTALKDGQADYIVGYHPIFFAVRCARSLFRSPYFLKGVGLACGFLGAMAKGVPRMSNRELRDYLRQQQLRRLFGRASIWE